MPLVRFPVRNEYGLGKPELYVEREREDPKAMLEGVAVAGLVGILRQLGDLAEFAAEVFHGLQEEVTVTSSRSRKLMIRVERIESSLPSLEKSMLAQKSHLHFAYTRGSVWRAHSKIEQNHFINGDLPEFIMDSYEECSDPPRLHLLDRFDRGGPGSCLKRYSDPTFFKKASALSRELNGEKSSKSRKSSRSKKKKSRHKTVAYREPSISNHTDRPQFASVQPDVQISVSPSHTVSTYGGTIKSDQEEQPNAFSLRTDSNYIECIFHPTGPVTPEEIEPENVSFTSSQILPDHSIFDLASVDECSRDVDSDNIVQNSLQEQIRASSSSVSWEEKEEIVEPTIRQVEHVESEGKGEVKNNVGDIESSVHNEGSSMTSQILSDDVDSEPDNFMDALNTIESEPEIDADFQTKHEVERSLHKNNERVKDQIPGETAHHIYDLPSQTEQVMERSFSLNNGGTKCDLPIDQTKQELEQSCNLDSEGTKDENDEVIMDNSDFQFSILESPFDNPFSSQLCVHEDLSKIAEESSATAISANDTIVENVNTETLSRSSASEELNPQILLNNEVQFESGECQTNFEEKNTVQPVHVWTNGGLLGLEPSKPPVYADVGKGSLGQSNGLNNGDQGRTDELIQSSEIIERNSSKCSTSYQDESNAMSDKKTSWRFLSAVLDTKREKNGYFQLSNSFNSNLAQSFGRINGIIPKNEQKVPADGRALSNEANQLGDMSNGSHISVLSNRIPLNDFQRSLVNNETRGYRTLSDIHLNPMHSPSSSPPLQHMKISFQPANDSGTSKLKLKFPESGSYMLPSFQLVPEPNSSHHDIRSESDDDTFCRSSPYMSDDRPGNESESDSEQWDSDDNLQSKENLRIHNLLLKGSVSDSAESEENRHESIDVDYGFENSYAGNCSEPTKANLLPDIPSLGAMNPLFEQEMKNLSDENNFRKLHFPEECTPQPPPLPPSGCCNIKPSFNVITIAEQKSNLEEKVNNGNDLKLFSSTIASQTNLDSVNQHILGSINTPKFDTNLLKQHLENDKDVVLPSRQEPEERGSSGNKEVNQIRKGKIVDEKEDFLQQIRTQSFNLRRTGIMTEKPNVTTGPVTNARVVAILEKAHAIRQVIGCDDGEDEDSWSEA